MFTPSETLFTFQFTPLREGRQEATEEQLKLFQFQFTPLREGRLNDVHVDEAGFAFQFTPLREGRRAHTRNQQTEKLYFNSRPSARGDMRIKQMYQEALISIHAPPRGATERLMCAPIYCEFQFTPLREGRREWRYSHGACDDFNSRPSARGDGQVSVTNLSPNHFNSRPSARGDLMRVMTLAIFLHFNSRPSARGDARLVEKRIHEGQISIHAPPRGATLDGVHRVLILLFQFTPLREGRPAPPPNRRSAAYFNSRPSARGDVVLCRYEFAPDNFNSRPSARGDGTSTSLYPRGLFQFTPLREGRQVLCQSRSILGRFQFTPLREGRPDDHRVLSPMPYFNSRPSARGDAFGIL